MTGILEEGDGEAVQEYGIEVVAAIGREESTVLVVAEDHTLLAGDLICLNDQVTQVTGYPSDIMFTVSPAISASKGDLITLNSRANKPQEEFYKEDANDCQGYNWDKELGCQEEET